MHGGTRHAVKVVWAGLTALALTACVTGAPATDEGVPVVEWWTVPGHGDLEPLVQACNEAYDGAFELQLNVLSDDPVERRTSVFRRLLADDPQLDLVSLDSETTPEFARSGLLVPLSEARSEAVRETAYPEAVSAAEHEGDLFAVPFLWEPQLLWYRPSVAQRAGLDMSAQLAWPDLLAGAERAQASIVLDDPDGRVFVRWLTAVVGGSGAPLLDGAGSDATVDLDGVGGRQAVQLMSAYLASPAGSEPGSDVAERFASTGGGFALAGPSFIAHPAVQAVATDLAWAPFPNLTGPLDADVEPDELAGAVPVSGIHLAVTRGSRLPEAAALAVECLTSPVMAETLVADTGHALAYPEILADTLGDAYPLTEVVLASLEVAAPATVSPRWGAIDESVADTWTPLVELDDTVPERSQRRAEELLRGEGL